MPFPDSKSTAWGFFTDDWVRLEHGAIVVLDMEALRELAESGLDGG